MNKEEFLKTLRKRLNVLEDNEVEDIISEYEGYIEEKVNLGKSEVEAVKELGNIDEIINDLLAAYKVKTNVTNDNSLNKFIDKIINYIDKFIEELSKKSPKEIIRFMIEICLVLLLISAFKLPFSLLKELGWNLFSGLPLNIRELFFGIWSFIIELTYFAIAIILFFKIFEKRYFENISNKIITSIEEDKKETKIKKDKEKTKSNEEINSKKIEQKETKSIFNSITNICLIFLKFIVIMCLIGVIFYLIGMTFAFGIMVYLIINGVKYFGLAILFLALIQGGILLLELGLNFILNKKQKASKILIEIISIIIFTGVGLTLSAVEIANTKIIYDNYYKDTKILTKEITMHDNLMLYNYDNIIIDNKRDNIKIEYKYPNIYDNIDISIKLNSSYANSYYLDTNINELKWNKKIIEDIINNLKDKKIYTYEFYVDKTIYISEKNYNKMINNINKENYHNDYKIYNFTKTYKVINILNNTTDNYLHLTLKDNITNEIEKVKIPKTNITYEINNYYNFTFEHRGDYDLDDIDDIFDECKLIKVEKTDEINNIGI